MKTVALILLCIFVLNTVAQAGPADNKWIFDPAKIPFSEQQIEAAKRAAYPLAQEYAQNGLHPIRIYEPNYSGRDFRAYTRMVVDPREPEKEIFEATVKPLVSKNGIVRLQVTGLVNGRTAEGQIKWGIGAFRVIMDMSADGTVVAGPEINPYDNKLKSDVGQYQEYDPEMLKKWIDPAFRSQVR